MLPPPAPPYPITETVKIFCQSISATAPIYIDVVPEKGARLHECFPNVREKIEADGGEIVYGWAIWKHGNIFIEAEHHAVWRSEQGSLIDITPQEPERRSILFLPDAAATYDFETTDQLDNIRKSLVKNSHVDRMLELFSQRTTLKNSIPHIGGTISIQGEALKQFKAIELELRHILKTLQSSSSYAQRASIARSANAPLSPRL